MKENIANSEKKKIIEKKSMDILKRLNLGIKNSSIVNQLGIILRLYKYVIQNVHEGSNIELSIESGTKEEEYVNGLYCGLTDNPGFQTTNAILLKHLLYMKGFDSYIVLSKSRTGNDHVSNLAKVGKEWYFFDTNLERSIYEENGGLDLLYCCAALGIDEYSKFYSPIGVLPENLKNNMAKLPSNVAEESMPRTLINSITQDIPDFHFEQNTASQTLEGIDVQKEKESTSKVRVDCSNLDKSEDFESNDSSFIKPSERIVKSGKEERE